MNWQRYRKCFDRLEDAVFALNEERAEMEEWLLKMCLANPKRGYERATECGWTHWDFDDEDYRIIYLAIQVTCEKYGREVTLRIAQRALEEEGSWKSRWSEAILSRWVRDWEFWTADIPYCVRRMREIDYRLTEARRCWKRMVRLLRGDWDDVVVKPVEAQPSRSIVTGRIGEVERGKVYRAGRRKGATRARTRAAEAGAGAAKAPVVIVPGGEAQERAGD